MYGLLDHSKVPVMTTGFAHTVMQLHVDCAMCVCALKRQAKARLIELGKMVPADAEHFGF